MNRPKHTKGLPSKRTLAILGGIKCFHAQHLSDMCRRSIFFPSLLVQYATWGACPPACVLRRILSVGHPLSCVLCAPALLCPVILFLLSPIPTALSIPFPVPIPPLLSSIFAVALPAPFLPFVLPSLLLFPRSAAYPSCALLGGVARRGFPRPTAPAAFAALPALPLGVT